MSKRLIVVLCYVSLFSCKKNSITPPSVADQPYANFFAIKGDYLDGKINGTTYNWRLTTSDQYVQQGVFMKERNITEFAGFYTTLCDAKFELYTPFYTTKEQLFSLLSVGKKKLANTDDAFRIKLIIPIGHKTTYNCVGSHNSGLEGNNYLEILKAEKEFDTEKGKAYMKVWLKFGATLYHESDQTAIQFTKGQFIGRFWE